MNTPDEDHRGHRANPVKVRGHDAVLRARCAHPDHFLRAQIGRQKRQAGDPDRHVMAGRQKLARRGDGLAQPPPDANHEAEVEREDANNRPLSVSSGGRPSFLSLLHLVWLLQETDRLQTEVGIGSLLRQIGRMLKSLRKADVTTMDPSAAFRRIYLYSTMRKPQTHGIESARKKSFVTDRLQIRHFHCVASRTSPLFWCAEL